MARKRSARDLAETSKPRQLRKRLRKAEDQLADAQQKRDRAQARVEALSIIADEIRAQLAEADKAAELDAAVTQEAETPPSARRKRAASAEVGGCGGQRPGPQQTHPLPRGRRPHEEGARRRGPPRRRVLSRSA